MKKERGKRLHRRSFLKSGGSVLPAIAVLGLGLTMPLSAHADCEGSCKAVCATDCEASCLALCATNCETGCGGGCKDDCVSSCKGSLTGTPN